MMDVIMLLIQLVFSGIILFPVLSFIRLGNKALKIYIEKNTK